MRGAHILRRESVDLVIEGAASSSALGMLRYYYLLMMTVCLYATASGKPNTPDLFSDLSIQDKGHAALEKYRSYQWSGDFSFFIELRHMPRHGRDSIFEGQMWGTADEEGGTLQRFHLSPVGKEKREGVNLILKNGNDPYVISQKDASKQKKYRKLSGRELFEPLFEGLVYTPFDLQMPFIYWKYTFKGYERTKGRPVYTYIMYPPDSLKKDNPNLGVIRLSLDARFTVLVKIQVFDDKELLTKTFKINSFKKVRGEWIPKSIDLLDEHTRDKTRFNVVAAAFNLNLPRQLFSSHPLDSEMQPISIDTFEFLK